MGMAHCVGLAYTIWELYLIEQFYFSSDTFDNFAQGFTNLTLRQWFSRIWVIPEIGLASKPPIILAGGAWAYIESLFNLYLVMVDYPKRSLINHLTGSSRIRFFHLLSSMRKDYQGGKYNQGVPEISSSSLADNFTLGTRLDRALGSTRGHFEATIPHDYIYGLLGLVGTDLLPHPLTPDYRKTYVQVCQEYAKFIIEHTGRLSILLRRERAKWSAKLGPGFLIA
jgi:hypothetical protein